MAEGSYKQQSQFPDRDPGGDAQTNAISPDNASSVAAREALQAAAQQRIDATRHDGIGSAP